MGNINQGYYDRVRYILRNQHLSDQIITEPEGWRTDEIEMERNKTYHGIFPQFSNQLKFVGDAVSYINLIRSVYGINERVKMIREERDPVDDVWNETYFGFLDISTWESEEGKVSCKFNSGGLEQSLKARDSDTFELDRVSTESGFPLPDLVPIQVSVDGREIFLKSQYNIKTDENSVTMINETSDGNTRGSTIGVPLNLNSKSHEEAQSVLPGTLVGDSNWLRTADGENGNMFFAVSDKKRILKISFTITFTVDILILEEVDNFQFWLRLAHYEDSSEYKLKENKMLFTSTSYSALDEKTFSVNFKESITVEQGDSLSLCFDQNYDGKAFHTSKLTISVKNIICDNFSIEEDSFYDKSTTKAILNFELFERLIAICTNKQNILRSNVLGRTDLGYPANGKWAFTAFTHGFWVRGFDKLPIPSESPKVENLFKPFTTSFKEHFESNNAVLNLGVGIEKEGNKEIVRIEELSYFYNRNVTVRLPNQIKKVKRKESEDNYFSSLQFGYEKGGDYEEAMGLDEPNAKSKFTTIINGIRNEYMKISKHRADSYGFEFARRKSVNLNSTQDTTYDNDIFWMDLKKGFNHVFLQRKWQDDFDKSPTGIFSPGTATNLRFSPFNMLLRHAWYFGAGFKLYLDEFVRYASSTANSKMKTKLIGKPEYSESGIVQNLELERPKFVCEEVEFDHLCDYDVMRQINGTTVILGQTIRNIYGLIEYTNEFNETERGFLLNLKPNGEGKFKVLKFNN